MNARGRSTLAVLLVLAIGLGACAPAATTAPPTTAPLAATTAPAQKQYTAVLINSFMGNTWRPIMEREVQLAVEYPPLNSKIKSLRIINTDNTATAENVAIASLLVEKPDIILIDAASETGSNQAVKEACDAGIIVVAFDGLVSEPCAWKIALNFYASGEGIASWLVNAIGGKGTIFWDLGKAGIPPIAEVARGAKSVLDQHPDIKYYTFYGDLAEGTEQQQVATLVTAHPEVNGVLSFGYGSGIGKALLDAGHALVPMTLTAYNSGMIFCNEHNVPCITKSSPTYVGASALMLAVDVLDGKVTGAPTTVNLDAPWFVNNTFEFLNNDKASVLQIKDYARPDLDLGLVFPISPPFLIVQGIEWTIDQISKPPVLQ